LGAQRQRRIALWRPNRQQNPPRSRARSTIGVADRLRRLGDRAAFMLPATTRQIPVNLRYASAGARSGAPAADWGINDGLPNRSVGRPPRRNARLLLQPSPTPSVHQTASVYDLWHGCPARPTARRNGTQQPGNHRRGNTGKAMRRLATEKMNRTFNKLVPRRSMAGSSPTRSRSNDKRPRIDG